MILLVPTLVLRHKEKDWALLRCEVDEKGEIFQVDILPMSQKEIAFSPLFTARVVEDERIGGERLVYRTYGEAS